MRTRRPLAHAAAAFLLLAARAPAQPPPTSEDAGADPTPTPPIEAPAPPAPAEPPDGLSISLRGSGEWTFRADIEDVPADVAIYRIASGLTVGAPLSERLRLSVALDGEFSDYDFEDALGLIPDVADPLPQAYRAILRPQLTVAQSRNLSWFVGGIVQSSGSVDADFGDTITGGGYGGVRLRTGDRSAITLGAGAVTRLEDGVLAAPIIGFEWGGADRGPASGGRPRFSLTSDGLGATLRFGVTEQLGLIVTGAYELREYRLEQDAIVPVGVLRDERAIVGGGIEWRPWRRFSLELIGGAVPWQEYEVDDQEGDPVARVNTDAAPFIRLSARFTF